MSIIWDVAKSALRRTDAALSLELKNEGSVARDHLASERTYLAWLRTSLGLVSIGIAVTQLLQLPSLVGESDGLYFQQIDLYSQESASDRILNIAKLGKPLGGAFILLGMIVLLFGCYRYFSVQAHLVKGKYMPSRAGISLITLLVAALVMAALATVDTSQGTHDTALRPRPVLQLTWDDNDTDTVTTPSTETLSWDDEKTPEDVEPLEPPALTWDDDSDTPEPMAEYEPPAFTWDDEESGIPQPTMSFEEAVERLHTMQQEQFVNNGDVFDENEVF